MKNKDLDTRVRYDILFKQGVKFDITALASPLSLHCRASKIRCARRIRLRRYWCDDWFICYAFTKFLDFTCQELSFDIMPFSFTCRISSFRRVHFISLHIIYIYWHLFDLHYRIKKTAGYRLVTFININTFIFSFISLRYFRSPTRHLIDHRSWCLYTLSGCLAPKNSHATVLMPQWAKVWLTLGHHSSLALKGRRNTYNIY